MALFNSLIAEIDSKFGLGAKSSAFIAEVIRFMIRARWHRWVSRPIEASLASLVSSRLGNKNPEPAESQQRHGGGAIPEPAHRVRGAAVIRLIRQKHRRAQISQNSRRVPDAGLMT